MIMKKSVKKQERPRRARTEAVLIKPEEGMSYSTIPLSEDRYRGDIEGD